MGLVLDPITVLNLVFDLIIVGLGAFAYVKLKSIVGGLIGVGFGFFATSYILTILGYGSSTVVLVPLRVLGYLCVIGGLCFCLYQAWPKPTPTTLPAPV
ncbi:MAG: hypothetical protein ABSA15_01355 [Thermoplasmata archaeon]|jgi:hypothetical protein